jgi:heme/copper-type cytochrome/quinol oxidase subunit 2
MPVVVEVLSKADYAAWVARQKAAKAPAETAPAEAAPAEAAPAEPTVAQAATSVPARKG